MRPDAQVARIATGKELPFKTSPTEFQRGRLPLINGQSCSGPFDWSNQVG